MSDAPAASYPTNELWNKAYETVAQGDLQKYVKRYEKILLQSQGAGTSDLSTINRENQMYAVLEEQAATLKKARWGLVISGQKFGVADVVDKIVSGILYAKDFIGKAITAAGEPHAALAWAGVCLLLPVCLYPTRVC